MSTLPIEDEKDLRLITDMEFANDTSPEEKAALRKWTKLSQELEAVRKEIERCAGEWNDLKDLVEQPISEGVSDPTKYVEDLALRIENLKRHIEDLQKREVLLDAQVKVIWSEYEGLRDKAEPLRKEKALDVRGYLKEAGLQTAQQIIDCGCTGLFYLFKSRDMLLKEDEAIERAIFVRENMGGARISLTCFVGPDRYCLIHQTIGGLQHGQKAQYVDQIPFVSRELTPQEKGHVALVESVRRREGSMREGKMMLTGRKVPEDLNVGPLSPQDQAFKEQISAIDPVPVPTAPPFTCPEHGVLSWGCRFCLAQALVNGSLEPELVVNIGVTNPMSANVIEARKIPERLEDLDRAEVKLVQVYACVATFRRKLAME